MYIFKAQFKLIKLSEGYINASREIIYISKYNSYHGTIIYNYI